MAVGPTHRRLQQQMQAIEADRQRHFDPPHNTGLDVVELDPEMRDFGGSHAARLRSSLWRGQGYGSNSSRREAG